MPIITVPEEQVVALAKQLPPQTRQALALALLREREAPPSLAELQKAARPKLAELFRKRGLDLERMSPAEIDATIQQICEEP